MSEFVYVYIAINYRNFIKCIHVATLHATLIGDTIDTIYTHLTMFVYVQVCVFWLVCFCISSNVLEMSVFKMKTT